MYSNLTNGEHSGGDGYESSPHASPSAVGSEPTLQHGQSMDSVAGAGEDEVGICMYVCFVCSQPRFSHICLTHCLLGNFS